MKPQTECPPPAAGGSIACMLFTKAEKHLHPPLSVFQPFTLQGDSGDLQSGVQIQQTRKDAYPVPDSILRAGRTEVD